MDARVPDGAGIGTRLASATVPPIHQLAATPLRLAALCPRGCCQCRLAGSNRARRLHKANRARRCQRGARQRPPAPPLPTSPQRSQSPFAAAWPWRPAGSGWGHGSGKGPGPFGRIPEESERERWGCRNDCEEGQPWGALHPGLKGAALPGRAPLNAASSAQGRAALAAPAVRHSGYRSRLQAHLPCRAGLEAFPGRTICMREVNAAALQGGSARAGCE